MTQLTLKHIHKKYDNAEKYSVTDFNLEIDDKEFIVFVGPSGCGKFNDFANDSRIGRDNQRVN